MDKLSSTNKLREVMTTRDTPLLQIGCINGRFFILAGGDIQQMIDNAMSEEIVSRFDELKYVTTGSLAASYKGGEL